MTIFELYRYQILPVDRHLQGDLISGITTVEELLDRKNEFLHEALSQTQRFRSSRTETITRLLYRSDDFYLYRIAANRSIHREKRDFTDEYLDTWPSVLVAIWNDPAVQMVAVQKRTTAFQDTKAVVSLIFESIGPYLTNHQLRLYFEPLFEKRIFWELVARYEGRVQSVEFEFLTPNMANISQTLPENLRELAKQTNSATNSLKVSSDPEASLSVEENNSTIQGLVDYSASGGGNIAVKISGIKKKKHTSRTVKEIEMDDIQLQGTAEEISGLLKE